MSPRGMALQAKSTGTRTVTLHDTRIEVSPLLVVAAIAAVLLAAACAAYLLWRLRNDPAAEDG